MYDVCSASSVPGYEYVLYDNSSEMFYRTASAVGFAIHWWGKFILSGENRKRKEWA